MTGQKFWKLTVKSRAENDRHGKPRWHCICECGKEKIVSASNLKRSTKSCGCFRKKAGGMSRTKLYRTLIDMKQRCYNPKNKRYVDYGGRGIIISDEWLGDNGFENFYSWSMDNGFADNLEISIDRIDNELGYSPDNCRWATRKEQQNNTRWTTHITINGETKPVSEWSEKTGLSRDTLKHRAFDMQLDDDQILNYNKFKHPQSGHPGVNWKEPNKKWQASLVIKRKQNYIGLFDTIEEAVKAKEEYIKRMEKNENIS